MNSSAGMVTSSMAALTQRYRAVAHNLANAGTIGFKKSQSVFAQTLDQHLGNENGIAPSGIVEETSLIDFTQGALNLTGRPMDLAVSGDAFFVIETADGLSYTRNGRFTTTANGQIVDFRGNTVAGKGGPLTLPEGTSPAQMHVSNDGTITVNGQDIGALKLVKFADNSSLVSVGNGCFKLAEGAEGAPQEPDAADYTVQQGFTESSNVNTISELVDLITITRLYEANLKSITNNDDRYDSILRIAAG